MDFIKISFITLSLFHFLSLISQTNIQMEKVGGVFEVPCKVNGLTLKFIFDTGAGDVTISLTEALYMVKNGYLKEKDILGTETYQTADGSISEGTLINIRLIEFANYKLYNVKASVVHSLNAPLLLGQTALAQLGKFQFDPKSGMLTILANSEKSNHNYSEMATIALTNKDYSSAVLYLEKKKQENFNNLTNNDALNLGKAYFFLGREKSNTLVNREDAKLLYLRADSSFKALTLLNPDWPVGYAWRGRTNCMIDPGATNDVAKQYYEKVLGLIKPAEIATTYRNYVIEACEYLGYYFITQRDNEKARTYFIKIRELEPDNEKAKNFFEQQ